MSILRLLTGAILVSLVLLLALIPYQLVRTRAARAANAAGLLPQKESGKRVYTNDDLPPRGSPPEPAASHEGASAGKPVPGPPGERVAPYVPTPMEIVDKMLELAGVSSQDVVYDLGSGDGRIVLRAAEKYGARSVGVELDHGLALESAERAQEMKLDKLVTIIEGDLFKTDIKPATVVTVYLLLQANDRLRPLLERDLRPGTRVVAHDIRIPGWEPSREESVAIGTGTHFVYLYRVPDAFRKPPPR